MPNVQLRVDGFNVAENKAKQAAVQGKLRERPLARVLQQLYRKKFTGYFVVADQTGDESEVYLRDGAPVHVHRPVDTDRLDNLLVEYGVVPAEIVAQASAQVSDGTRLGELLERMGVLDRQKLAGVIKTQVMRKLTRLFFVNDGTYAIFVSPHAYGQGDDLPLMRVDPRSVFYPGIRAAYDLPRVTQELSRLVGQRFRLADISPGFLAALGIPAEDQTVEALRQGWMTLDDLDSITSRPFEVRSVVLSLYYADSLAREPVAQPLSDSAVPSPVPGASISEGTHGLKGTSDSGPNLQAILGPSERSAGIEPHPPVTQSRAGASLVASAPAQTRSFAASAPVVVVGARTTASPPQPGGAAVGAPVVWAPYASAARVETKAASGLPAQATTVPRSGAIRVPDSALRMRIQEMFQKLGRLNHFELLGVASSATSAEVSTAFVRAARQFHPDRLASAGLQDLYPMAEKILARINESAMVLGDATRRAEYVALLSAGPQAARTNMPTVLEAENTFLKGEVFLKKGDFARAIECFTMAQQGNPGEPQYRAYLAWSRFDDPHARKETLVRETLATLESVLRERPRFVRGHYWVGQLWKFLNEGDKAAHAFHKAVELDSSFIEASRELRLIEMRKNKLMSAKSGAKSEVPGSGGGMGGGGGLMGKFFKK
jgi:tetratricopeptide (TPR) repeat protein